MTARPPRRRRRGVPAASLPRPAGQEADGDVATMRGRAPRVPAGHREHHVTTDYSYIHRDLLTVAAVGAVVVAFIVGMSFVV